MDFLKSRLKRSRTSSFRSKAWRRTAASAVLAAFVLLGQPALSLAQVNSPTWMADQSDYIANIPLKGIAMLGTHDAAMYIEPGYADFAKTQNWDFTGQLDRGVRWFDTRIVRLDASFTEPDGQTTCQAVTGAILPYPGPGYYLYGHGGPDRCTGVTLPTVLDQISQWLDQHPKEILILQLVGGSDNRYKRMFSTGYPDGNNDVNDVNSAAAFEAVLDQHLRRASDHASYIYDLPTACTLAGYQHTSAGLYQGACSGSPILPQEVTPQQLWTTSARVILLEQFYLGVNLPSGISPQLTWVDLDGGTPNQVGHERLTGYFGNGSSDPTLEFSRLEYGDANNHNSGLYGYRPDYQSYESDNRFLAMQAELTPYGDGVDQSLGGVSPYYEAGSFNPQLNSMLQSSWLPYSVNIVSIDRADDEAVLANVVAYNQRTFGRVPSGYVTPAQVVVGRDGNIYEVAGGEVWQRINFTGQPYDWTPRGFSANRLAVDGLGRFWTVDSSGNIGLQGASSTVPGIQFHDVTVGNDGAVFALSTTGDPYQVFSSNQAYVTSVGLVAGIHNLVSIAAGSTNTLTAADTSGTVWRYTSNGNWTNLNNNPSYFRASSVTVDEAGNVWATERESSLTTIFRPLTDSSIPYSRVWSLIGGKWGPPYRQDGVQVSAGASGTNNVDVIYALSHDGLVHNFRYNLSTGLGAQAPPPKRYAVAASVSGLTFDHAKQVFTGTLTITNNTGSPITDQLAVVYQGLPQGVTVANNPLTYQGLPFTLMPTVTLQPGDSTSTQVQFSDPNLVHINYLTEVFAYVAGS